MIGLRKNNDGMLGRMKISLERLQNPFVPQTVICFSLLFPIAAAAEVPTTCLSLWSLIFINFVFVKIIKN